MMQVSLNHMAAVTSPPSCTPPKRHVSSSLTTYQSHQLITAFYVLCVERIDDPLTVRVASLILYRYMVERGYTEKQVRLLSEWYLRVRKAQ